MALTRGGETDYAVTDRGSDERRVGVDYAITDCGSDEGVGVGGWGWGAGAGTHILPVLTMEGSDSVYDNETSVLIAL